MTKTPHYQPVSCDLHSELELNIMHGKRLQIQFSKDDELLTLVIKPMDIVSRRGEGEFLLAIDESGQALEMRLDKIRNFQAL